MPVSIQLLKILLCVPIYTSSQKLFKSFKGMGRCVQTFDCTVYSYFISAISIVRVKVRRIIVVRIIMLPPFS